MQPGDLVTVRDGPFTLPARVMEVDGELVRVAYRHEPPRWFHVSKVRLQTGNRAFHTPDDGEDCK